MAEQTKPQEMTYDRLLARLLVEKVIGADQARAARDHINEDDTEDIPWYIHALSGIGGLMACLMFLGFLGCTQILESEVVTLVVGAVLVAGMTGYRAMNRLTPNILTQASLSAHLCGQALCVFALEELMNAQVAAMAYMAIAAVTYFFDRTLVMRFLVSMGFVSAASTLCAEWLSDSLALHAIHIGLMAGVSVIFSGKLPTAGLRRMLLPFGFSCALSLVVFMLGVNLDVGDVDEPIMRLTMALPLAALLGLALTRAAGWRQKPALWGALVALMLALAVTSGILTGVLLLVIGFWHMHRSLIVLGAVSLVGFLAQYYYSLEITLLAKSMVLVGSGVVLLVFWWAMRTRMWMRHLVDREKELLGEEGGQA